MCVCVILMCVCGFSVCMHVLCGGHQADQEVACVCVCVCVWFEFVCVCVCDLCVYACLVPWS